MVDFLCGHVYDNSTILVLFYQLKYYAFVRLVTLLDILSVAELPDLE